MLDTIALRPATAADQDFLLELYASTRADLAQLENGATRMLLVRMQFDAQQAHYQARFPLAEVSLIMAGDLALGRLTVARGAREIHLIDISLLPQHRRLGIGAQLLDALQEEAAAAALPVRLLVLTGSPALALYQRLGFVPKAVQGLHQVMEWQSPQDAARRATSTTS